MAERIIVLVDPELYRDPMFLDFDDNIPIGNRDEIVCEISINQAQKMLERKRESPYFEEHIDIGREVTDYLDSIEEENRIWEQVAKTEAVVQKMIKEEKLKKRKGNRI